MRTLFLSVTLLMVLAIPGASAATELETLRTRCLELEQEVQVLKGRIQKLQAASSIPAAVSDQQTPTTYTVRPGDFIEKIARKNGCSAVALAKANGLKTHSMIHPGQKLKLPGTAVARTPSSAPVAKASAAGKTHTVRAGETYSGIARKYGVSPESLIAANPSVKATNLRPGEVISLSTGTPSSAPAVSATSELRPLTPVASLAFQQPQPATPSAVQPSSPPIPEKAPLPAEQAPATQEKKIRSVTIENEMTYAEFAAKHGTDIARLNDLNGLDLTNATVLAKGSELYVPAPQ